MISIVFGFWLYPPVRELFFCKQNYEADSANPFVASGLRGARSFFRRGGGEGEKEGGRLLLLLPNDY